MVEERQGMKLLRRLFCTKNLRCHIFLVGEYIVAALFIFLLLFHSITVSDLKPFAVCQAGKKTKLEES